jgi:hypothetical protein
LERYAFSTLGDLDCRSIDTDLVSQVLEQPVTDHNGKAGTLWNVKTETAARVRQRIEAVLSWANARGYRDVANPPRGK